MKCKKCGKSNDAEAIFCEHCGTSLNTPVCPKCGRTNDAEALYCENCGASLKTSVCPKCGKENEPGSQFCEQCGQPLADGTQKDKKTSKPKSKLILAGGLVGGAILLLIFVVGSLLLRPHTSSPPAIEMPTEEITISEGEAPAEAEPATQEPIEPATEEPIAPNSGSGCTDRAEILSESIPGGEAFPLSTSFTKTWMVKNIGTCTWNTAYLFEFNSGTQMEAVSQISIPSETPPGQSVELPVEMVTPDSGGTYQGNWILRNSSGTTFGWGETADQPFIVQLTVDEAAYAVKPPTSPSDPSLALDPPEMGGGGVLKDSDKDGLSDEEEDRLANAFVPILILDGGEDVPKEQIMRLYQVTPLYQVDDPNWWNFPDYHFTGYRGPSGILITYVIAYPYDAGDAIFGIAGHAGDDETIRIFLVHPRNAPYSWAPLTIIIKRHFDPEKAYYHSDFVWTGTHVNVWVSEDKHAMYKSMDECDNYSVWFDRCGTVSFYINYPITPGVDGFNVGERRTHPFAKMPANSLGLFNLEWVWSSPESIFPEYDSHGNPTGRHWDGASVFCGGQGGAVSCASGLDGKWWPLPSAIDQGKLSDTLSSKADMAFVNAFGAEYMICFYTGNFNRAGTDFHINVELKGTSFSYIFFDLQNPNISDPFERGKRDCFEVGSYNLDQKLTGLSLLVWGDSGGDSEWYLQTITVQELFSNDSWQFDCYCWVDKQPGYNWVIEQNAIGPLIELEPFE